MFRLLRSIGFDAGEGSLAAVVGALAIAPSQVPFDCRGLHIIHVLQDELCVWTPDDATRAELERRGVRLTMVSTDGVRSCRLSLRNSLHDYASFVLFSHRIPSCSVFETLPLQSLLCIIPASSWVGNGAFVFLLLAWAMAERLLPGGFADLSQRIQCGLLAGNRNPSEVFEEVLCDTLISSSLAPGRAQPSCVPEARSHNTQRQPSFRRVEADFDLVGLRSSLRNLLHGAKPENIAFVVHVALPWMAANQR